jgi:hypothetical protein
MHAAIKIICFLLFSVAISLADVRLLLLGFLLLTPLYVLNLSVDSRVPFTCALQMLRRLRWLFLSIFIVYVFFTPGILLWTGVLWSPTLEGLQQGAARIAVLVLLVAAVNVLLVSTEQVEFFGALSWCLQPLSWLGLSPQRLAVRIVLTVQWVAVVRDTYPANADVNNTNTLDSKKMSEYCDPVQQGQPPLLGSRQLKLKRMLDTALTLFSQVVVAAETAPLERIQIPKQTAPPLLQWLWPLLLTVVFLLTTMI